MDIEKESRQRTKHKKKKSIGRTILTTFGFLLLFLATVGLTIGFLTVRPPDISDNKQSAEQTEIKGEKRTAGRYSVLVVGTDDAGLNTDTIMVASLDSKHNVASVMSIPRDTMSNVTRNVKKINAAYAAGAKDGVGNIDNLKKEVSYLMGFPVDNYVIIDLTAFEELIEAIGGVTIDVPQDMHYDDPYQDLHIHIEKGLQTLNGKDAIGFVRYRKGYAQGDLGRVQAQQMFIQALAEQVATPATVTKLPQLTDIVLDNMRTDLTYGELVWFVKEAVSVDMSTDLHMFTLPGVAETVKPEGSYQALSYYLPFEDEILALVNQYFNPYSRDLVSLNVVDTDALLRKAGIQREEKKQQEDALKETEDGEEPVELDENGNPIEKSDEDTIGDKNSDDSSSEETVDGNNGENIDENTDETTEPNREDTDNNENAESDVEPFDPNTQAPDEVLKSEVEQNENVVEENENTGEGNNTAEPNEDNSTFIPEPPVEEQPPAEVPSQSGGIPGEVLKSDLE